MTGQEDNGTVTLSPTDVELFEIGLSATTPAAERRALYEAGYGRHKAESDDRLDWLLTNDAIDFWNEQTKDWYQPRNVLKALHEKIREEEN